MVKKKYVYVITEGDYSDYKIIAVFSTRELAKVWMSRNPRDSGQQIEAYLLDDPQALKSMQARMKIFSVHMTRDGTSRIEQQSMNLRPPTDRKPTLSRDWRDREKYEIYMWTWARDKRHAVKIMNEWRTRWIATGEWDKQEAEMRAAYADSDRRFDEDMKELTGRRAQVQQKDTWHGDPQPGDRMGMSDSAEIVSKKT